jgi:hypothetical protein
VYCEHVKKATEKKLAEFMARRTTTPTPETQNHTLDFYFNSFFPAKDLKLKCSPSQPDTHNNYTKEDWHEFMYDIPKICAPKHLPKNWLHKDGPFETIFLTVVILFCFISLVHLMVSASTFSDMKPRLLPVVAVS